MMSQQLSIGVAGWSYPDWQGIVYPAGIKNPLGYLSRYVDCIEINSTFYRPADVHNSQSWLDKTAHKADFFFTAKLHQDFTHHQKLDLTLAGQFNQGLMPLLKAGKLRQLLMQFPFYFEDCTANRSHLTELVKRFSPPFELVVEVRHRSWQAPGALDFLDSLSVSVAHLDYPLCQDSFDLPCCKVGKSGYFRLHGRNAAKWFSKATRDERYDYYYAPDELAEIQNRVQAILRIYPSVVVIANNHYRGAEVANALELKAQLTGQKQPIPDGLHCQYPQLNRIAQNKTLF